MFRFNTMKVYRSLSDIQLSNTSVAIGVFDGVHRGHQEVLHRAASAAKALRSGTSLAFTFDRHPAELIAPRHAPLYLSSLSQRIELIERFTPIDAVLVVPFDHDFANLSATEFIRSILVDHLGAQKIFVGADFRYGKERSGGVMDLEAAGERYGFDVNVIHSVAEHGERVSSTRIRSLVTLGKVAVAGVLLGHPFSIKGTVVHGKKLGRTIGYPTANLRPEQSRQLIPKAGVYAGTVRLRSSGVAESSFSAAISVGVNPTTDFPTTETKIEAYILDGFSADIYGQTIDVDFNHFLREELKFDSLQELTDQIGRDVSEVVRLMKKSDTQEQLEPLSS